MHLAHLLCTNFWYFFFKCFHLKEPFLIELGILSNLHPIHLFNFFFKSFHLKEPFHIELRLHFASCSIEITLTPIALTLAHAHRPGNDLSENLLRRKFRYWDMVILWIKWDSMVYYEVQPLVLWHHLGRRVFG